MSARSWTVAVHALDRTGPPMLARAWIRWLRTNRPEDEVRVVAMRTGDLLDSFLDLCPTRVLLAPHEPYDSRAPTERQADQFEADLADWSPTDGVLLASLSAAQVLPYLETGSAPVVAWVLEQGEDLHWPHSNPDLVAMVTHWVAGAEGTRGELQSYFGDIDIDLSPEFIDPPDIVSDAKRQNCRSALAIPADAVLVMGAGIGSHRKAMDLFLECALESERRGLDHLYFVWLGGEADALFPLVGSEIRRLGLERMRLASSVTDVSPWFAAADIFLHPARLDAFPLVCLHAAAGGTPVVAFEDSVGVREMFDEDFVGAPFPDIAGLVGAVESLSDPDARQQVAARQGDRVLAEFTSLTAAEILYHHLCDAATRGRAK